MQSNLKRFVTLFIAAAALALGAPAGSAQAAACGGLTINNVSIASHGTIYVSVSGPSTTFLYGGLCKVTGTVGSGANTITKEACAAIHSELVAAFLAKKKVTLYFQGASCPASNSPSTWGFLSPANQPLAWGDMYLNANTQFYFFEITD